MDIIIHAAALKHVPVAEYNPFEAVKTNIIGAQNIIECAIKKNVKKTIALSTDKASSPINLYGATKLVSDKIFIAANNYKGSSKSEFSVVRYGNVFGSRGSIVSILNQERLKQINLTDPSMTRFFITLQKGADFVINCLAKMKGGEIFVPKLKSIRIEDLIYSIRPNIKIKVSGIRPGEKIHEELISSSDSFNTFEFKDRYVIHNPALYNFSIVKKNNGKKVCKKFNYCSNNNGKYLNRKEIRQIFEKEIKDIA